LACIDLWADTAAAAAAAAAAADDDDDDDDDDQKAREQAPAPAPDHTVIPTASNSAGSCQHHTTSSTHHKLSVCSTVNPVLHEYVNADSVLLQSNKLLSPVQPLSSE